MLHEIYKLKEIEKHLTEGSLIALDLDDTLITASTYHGSMKWADDLIKKYQKEGYKIEEAITQTIELWQNALSGVKMKLTEENSVDLINKWKESSSVIGLTARDFVTKNETHQSLKSHQISFSLFNDFNHAFYEKGILFCSGEDKKKLLSSFIKQAMKKKPEKILIVDDKKENLEKILDSHLKDDFQIHCFHYLNKIFYK